MRTPLGRLAEELRRAVLHAPGDTPAAARAAAHDRAADLALGTASDAPALPPEALAWVDAVAGHSWRVTDADVERLRAAGWSEDAILELTVSAAVGAGLSRLERGIGALLEG